MLPRKVRGILAIGVIWGVVWALIFATLAIVIGVIDPSDIDEGEGAAGVWPIGAFVGLVSGLAFGSLLALADNGRTVRQVSLGRAAIWGALGSAVFPLSTGKQDMVFVLCPIGAALAVACIAIARSGTHTGSKGGTRVLGALSALILACVRDVLESQSESAA